MPTYTYRCDTCAHGFDAFQRFAEDPLRECPDCGAPIHRVIQPVGIVFKGSGWYINDSRPKQEDGAGKKANGAAKGDDAAAGDGTTKKDDAAKVEAKPAAAEKASEPAKSDTPAKTAAAS